MQAFVYSSQCSLCLYFYKVVWLSAPSFYLSCFVVLGKEQKSMAFRPFTVRRS